MALIEQETFPFEVVTTDLEFPEGPVANLVRLVVLLSSSDLINPEFELGKLIVRT